MVWTLVYEISIITVFVTIFLYVFNSLDNFTMSTFNSIASSLPVINCYL